MAVTSDPCYSNLESDDCGSSNSEMDIEDFANDDVI